MKILLWASAALAVFAPATLTLGTPTAGTPTAAATQPAASAFDPARHMRVSEVRVGMTGYGLSVFRGTTIEKFDVEVLSVLKNFNPKYDVVLIKCRGANLEHTGAIAGMSGSPIYLKDDQGRYRMIGAFAYGWPLMKDPVGGVQPIEYMLALPTAKPPVSLAAATRPAGSDGGAPSASGVDVVPTPQQAQPQATWSLGDAVALPGTRHAPASYPLAGWNVFAPNPRLSADDADATRLGPLATPLMASGMSPPLLEQFGPIFRAYGLVPLQAGGIGGSAATTEPFADLEPGSVMAVPLLTGDMELTAIGTCTEVLGNRVWGFGHSFQNEGNVTLPVGAGTIHAVIANLSTSFKLGALTRTRGTLVADQAVGIAGSIGSQPETAPIELRVMYADGSADQTYRFQSALHPRFTPLIGAAAFTAAVSSARELPQYHTLDYKLELTFANGKVVEVANTTVNAAGGDLFFELATPIIAASTNPFERVFLKSIKGTVRVTPEAREAEILSVNVPRSKFRPGETVKAYVTYRPFRQAEAILPVDLALPRDLPDGEYQLLISDWERYFEDEQEARPFRFTAQSIEEVFAVLKDVASIRQNALYLRLVRQADGVAVGRTAMPHLPSSRREVLLSAGRSNTTAFVSSTVKAVPTDVVMNGDAEFTIKIDRNAKVETPGIPPRADAEEKEPVKAAHGKEQTHEPDNGDQETAPRDEQKGGQSPTDPASPAPAPTQ